MLQLAFNWKRLSVIAGVTVWTFSFRLYPGTIKSPQIVDFRRHLRRHTSPQAAPHLGWAQGVPELAGPAGCRGLQHELATSCPKDLAQLGQVARSRLRSMQRRRTLVTAFGEQAHLPF